MIHVTLSIRTHHRAFPSRCAPASSLSLPTSSSKTTSTTRHLHHPTPITSSSIQINIHTPHTHNDDAHNILLSANNAALLTLHATQILTTIRPLLKCHNVTLQLQHAIAQRKEASTRVQAKPSDADARRGDKAATRYVLQARTE
jgi:hypothetical protein